MGGRGRIALAAALATLAGCGPTPPQAPGAQAHALNKALAGISSECGHAAEIQAFSNSARDLTITEHQAEKQVNVLAKVWHRNRNWIFLGKSVDELVVMTNTYLDECGLHQAAARMRKLTSG